MADRSNAVTAYATLRTALASFEATPADLPAPELDELRQRVDRELAIQDAVLASDMAEGVEVDAADVTEAIRELQSRYAKKEDFLHDLARNGLNKKGLQQALGRELKVTAILALVEAMAPPVEEAELRSYYDLHRDRFVYPETREARHVLVTVNDDYPENCREAALKRIEQIGWGIGRKSDRFGEQAAKSSECPTAMQQGKLGRVRQGQLYPELDAVLFTMSEGEISRPIETEIGFHLLFCEKIHPAGEVSFEEAAPKIREMLQQAAGRRYMRRWLSELYSEVAAA